MTAPDLLSAGLAGLLSFASPCVLPLVPAYLSFVSGSTAAELSAGSTRRKVFRSSLAFSLGFTAAFTVLGILLSGATRLVGGASEWLGIASGALIVLLGLNMIFDFLKFLSKEGRLVSKFTGKKIGGPIGAFALGLAFAAGWSPCVGPILASILLFAGKEGNYLRAALLLLSYSLGFALPFLASGLFFDRLKPALSFLTRKGDLVRVVSGLVLVVFGLAMALGSLGSFSGALYRLAAGMVDFDARYRDFAILIGVALWLGAATLAAAPALPPRRAKLPPVRLAFALVFAGAAALEALGLFSTLRVLSSWLGFTGI